MDSSSNARVASDSELGRVATDQVWKYGVEKAEYVEVDSADFAASALSRFMEFMDEHAGGFMGDMMPMAQGIRGTG